MAGERNKSATDTLAWRIAETLAEVAGGRLFGLQGGHIQPIWDAAERIGLPVVDTRDERAAVHMAHAHGFLTGSLCAALVTAGPGVTNAVTAVANAHAAAAPLLLIGGAPPRPQRGRGALQELPQIAILRPITRAALALDDPATALDVFSEAISMALGHAGGEPGPVFVEIPTDLLRLPVPPRGRAVKMHPAPLPDAALVAKAAAMIGRAEKPLVISGRGARGAAAELVALLDATGAAYLDTQESRGLVPDTHPSIVSAMRGQAMAEADSVILVGRRLDYQLGYGSAAVFPNAQFIRIGAGATDLADNRPDSLVLPGDTATLLRAFTGTPSPAGAWARGLHRAHEARAQKLAAKLDTALPGSDGHMHPYRLLGALRPWIDDDTILVADGGDTLSFARIALPARTYLDPGLLGCLGVGVPFAIAAALACPDRRVISISGDGAFGFNAMELDTALRHNAKAVFIVANNGGWNIERHDQIVNYDSRINGAELRFSDYAGMARALGLHADRVEDPADLASAIERAFANAPSLLDVVVTRDAVSPDGRSGLANVPDLQPLAAWDAAERALRK